MIQYLSILIIIYTVTHSNRLQILTIQDHISYDKLFIFNQIQIEHSPIDKNIKQSYFSHI